MIPQNFEEERLQLKSQENTILEGNALIECEGYRSALCDKSF